MEPSAERVLEAQLVTSQFAGAWRRIGALLVDGAVLGLLGFPLGLLLGERFAPVGSPARLIGLLVMLPYLGVLGSRLGGGQTLGKRLLGLRVVDERGEPLPVGRALARAALLSLPWVFNGIRFGSVGPVVLATLWVAGILVFGVGGAILATFLFNRTTRQALHDLVAGSYVVQADGKGLPVPARSTRRPVVASAAWVGVVAVATAVLAVKGPGLVAKDFPAPLWDGMSAVPGVTAYELRNATHWSVGRSSTSVGVVLWVRGPPEETRSAALQAAAVLLRESPGAASADNLVVTVVRGWDVGISHLTTTHSFVQPPGQWQAELGL